MPLTILSDSDLATLLHSLTRDDIQTLQHNLAEALHDYSTGTQDTTVLCHANQPSRIIVGSKESKTIFMPGRTATCTGVKVVTLASPVSPASPSGTTSSSSASTTSLTPSSSSTAAPTASTSATTATLSSSQSTTPLGTLTLLRPNGAPFAFLSATELTAFRTALASTLLFSRREKVHTIVVFGAGRQAYWHIRLALLLRGHDIHHVRIVNRTFAGAEPLLKDIYKSPEWEELRDSNNKLDFSVLSTDFGEYNRMLKEQVRDADVIFCCTPATAPLFPADHLTSSEGRKKGRYISLIGSYQPHMCEIDPEILRQAVAHDHGRHHHKHAKQGGVIVVDSLEACLKEAGEIIQAGLSAEQLVEVGELIMVKRAVLREVEMGGAGDEGLYKWLKGGNVVYKSVGLGLMDLCVGEDLVNIANEKGVGTRIKDF